MVIKDINLMPLYTPNEFSILHNNGNINGSVNYLLTVDSMNENDVIDVLIKMMRCNDNNAWTQSLLPVLITKYNGNHTFISLLQKASIKRASEQVGY